METPHIRLSDELGHFVSVLNTAENEDDPSYLSALEKLRGRGAEVIREARQLLDSSPNGPADVFALRHSVVLAMAALIDPDTLDLLSEVALNPQPLPPDPPPERVPFEAHPEHRLDAEAVVQRTIVALDAVEGIEALAENGHEAALDALVAVAASPSNAVRAAALTVLGTRPEWRVYRDRAMEGLPDGLGHLAHLVRKGVGDVPQIRDPRATLIGTGDATIRAPGLDDKDGFHRVSVPGAPRVGRK